MRISRMMGALINPYLHMRWLGREGSGNIEDQRSSGGGGGFGGGGLKLGGGLGIIVLIISLLLGGNPAQLLQNVGGDNNNVATEQTSPTGVQQTGDQEEDKAAQFVSVVLKDTEDVWDQVFAEMGMQYQHPRLVLFRGQVQSGCGGASSATGPFYCPADRKVYIDLSFYDDLSQRFRAPGDFAMAYVVAHEVGHHVQNLLGTSDKVDAARRELSETEFNKVSVRLELQADYYAGLWANRINKTKQVLEEGDIDEALKAANAIGDDNLQKQSQGYVVPDAFTHGTSAQRVYWFKKGFNSGRVQEGNTFKSEI